MLYERVVEIPERVRVDGSIETPLDLAAAEAALKAAHADGIRSVAILFMHGYRYTAHEAKVADLAKTLGFTQVSASHQVSPLIKFVRSEERRVGKESVSTCRSRWSPYH